MFSSPKNKIFGSTQTTPEQQAEDTTNQDFVGGAEQLPSVIQKPIVRKSIAKKTTVTKKRCC
jgi:hypothetical protein